MSIKVHPINRNDRDAQSVKINMLCLFEKRGDEKELGRSFNEHYFARKECKLDFVAFGSRSRSSIGVLFEPSVLHQ